MYIYMSDSSEVITILNQNIRSLRQNFDMFLCEVSSLKFSPHFIILTEVWIFTDEVNLFNIDGYNVFSCNSFYRAGGVVVYAKSRYQCTSDKQIRDHLIASSCLVHLTISNLSFWLCIDYTAFQWLIFLTILNA
jgi:hypothetical protein